MNEVYVFEAVRTPRTRARASGALAEVPPHVLLAQLLRDVGRRVGPEAVAGVTDLLAGCVTPIGDQGYNVAQAALLTAGWPDGVAAAQVNRFCASGLETVHQAYARVACGLDEAIVAGGVESMSRVPLGSDGGPLLYDPELMLRAAAIPQGVAADLIATARGFDRENVDAYALASQRRAAVAAEEGRFAGSLVTIRDETGLPLAERDGHPRPNTTAEGLAGLSPAFATLGAQGFDALALRRFPTLERIEHVHTAGNSSGLVDGAALALVGSADYGARHRLRARLRIRSVAVASADPTMMLLGLIPATELALARAGVAIADLDLVEANEAFAAVVLAFADHFGADRDRLNVNGGAIALGHPVGATGAILLGTLADELERRDGTLGLVTLCAGGGQGIAAVVERVA